MVCWAQRYQSTTKSHLQSATVARDKVKLSKQLFQIELWVGLIYLALKTSVGVLSIGGVCKPECMHIFVGYWKITVGK